MRRTQAERNSGQIDRGELTSVTSPEVHPRVTPAGLPHGGVVQGPGSGTSKEEGSDTCLRGGSAAQAALVGPV